MAETAAETFRYFLIVEDPKGSGRLAVQDIVTARSKEEATMLGYQRNPGQGPFKVASEPQPVPMPDDVARLLSVEV